MAAATTAGSPIRSARGLVARRVLLRDHFTEGNVGELLDAAAGKGKREVQELVARLAAKPDAASSIRKLPTQSVERAAPAPTIATPSPPPPARKPVVEPLSESRYRVQLTASGALREKLEKARALMRHRDPSGDLAVVVEHAMDLLLAKLEKDRLGKTERPRESKSLADPGAVSRAVRREVVARDGAQCSFVSSDGERCPSRDFLELDHRRSRALR